MHSRFALMGSSLAYVQYWRSFEHLADFARNPDEPHLPAWKEFNQRVRGSGDVGIWHETYRVGPGQFEAIYGNMPRWGLGRGVRARAGRQHRPGSRRPKRIGASAEDRDAAVDPD